LSAYQGRPKAIASQPGQCIERIALNTNTDKNLLPKGERGWVLLWDDRRQSEPACPGYRRSSLSNNPLLAEPG